MVDSSGGNSKKIARKTEMDNLALGISTSRFSRDLLQRFLGSRSLYEEVKDDEDDEIELNLGLSLGGRFGVDKSSNNLARSSSIASCLPVVRDDNDAVAPTPAAYSGLMRTSSLPVETEDEWRKRKELQTLRRMEAKRRRSEKQMNLKGDKEKNIGRSGSLTLEERKEIEVHLRDKLDRKKYLRAVRRLSSSVGSQYDLSMRSAVALAKGKGSFVGSSGGMQGDGQPASQGSVESKGVSSSCLSDLGSKSLQGSTGELSPTSIQSMQEATNRDVGPSGTRAKGSMSSSSVGPEMVDTSSKRPETTRPRGREIGTNALGDMPCVFTKGEGPNGRRVDGILYKYGKLGEEVRIMCVCHGSFHSPAEFVKHAGGTDVDHPLKHIVIKPS